MNHLALRFEFADLLGTTVTRIAGEGALEMDDGSTAFDAIIFYLKGESAFRISCSANTDEVVVERVAKNETAMGVRGAQLTEFVGSRLGWGWVGINSHGYKDMFVLSFNGIEPQIALVGMASKIHIYKMRPQ